jgi:hypothetical protein
MHEINAIIHCYAAHRCDVVRELADRLCIRLHFIPPGLTDILQPLDRALFGALKAEYRAICRFGMSQREDESMTKACHVCTCCWRGSWCGRMRSSAFGSATAQIPRCW